MEESKAPAVAVWFRQDLRVTDHAPLLEAAQRAAGTGAYLHCVYCVDPREYEPSPHLRLPRTGPFRARFLAESLQALGASLRALGSDLIVRHGCPAEVLPLLAQEGRWQALYYHRLVGTEERRLERLVSRSLREREPNGQGPEIYPHWDRTLHADYPFDVAQTPDVFSQFRKRVERYATVEPPLESPSSLPAAGAIEPGEIPTAEKLGAHEGERDGRGVLAFRGGEAAGRARLEHFVGQDHVRTYKETRNGLVGPDYSSKLSPWLALGCLSCRTVQAEIQAHEDEHGGNDSTYWMFFELLWRDYFQLILLKHGAAVFRPSGLQGIEVPWVRNAAQFEAWRTGRTGYPFVDANMRELLETGFMSNRGRQNVGSFLTKNLGIDWRLGAEWFEVQLVDHDVASNYGNWNYTAGVGNDARGFRYFHIPKQARTYDPEGRHARLWLPELSELEDREVHAPWLMPDERQAQANCVLGRDYPHPMVDLEQSQDRQRRAWESAVAKTSA